MNNNSWFKKERPLLGLLGMGGSGFPAGADDSMQGSGGYVNEYADPGSPTGYYRTHVFVSPGRFRVTTTPTTAEFQVLTIGGGGGGGSNNGGGGGAGGWIEKTDFVADTENNNYDVKIGRGGAGRYQSAQQSPYASGGTGGDTIFEYSPTVTMNAGGGGGGNRYANGAYNDLYTPTDLMTGRSNIGSGGGGGYGPSPGGSTQNSSPAGSSVPAPLGTGRGNSGGSGGAFNVLGGGGGSSNAGTAGANGNANAPGYTYGAGGNGMFNNWVYGPTVPNRYYAGGGGASSNMNGDQISPNDCNAGNGGYGGGGGGSNGGPGHPGGVTANQGAGGVSGGWGRDGEDGLNTSGPTSLPYYNNNVFHPDPNGYGNRGGSAAHMTGSGGGGGGGSCNNPNYGVRYGKQVSGGNGAPGMCLVRYSIAAPAQTGTATGGLISETPTHRIHTFVGPGTLVTTPTFNSGSDQPTGEIVAVGGGGSGGAHFGGGGGAGRFYTGAFTVRKGSTYTIEVGEGGEGCFNGPQIPGVEGTQTTITHPTAGTEVYCGGGGGGGTRDGGPTIDQGWPGQGPTFSRGSGGGAGAGYGGGVGSGGSGPGTNDGGAYDNLLAGGGGGSAAAGTAGSNPTSKSGPGGGGTQIPSTFRDSETCVFGAKGPGSSENTGSSWGWFAGGGGGGGGYPSGDVPTAMPKFGAGGGSPQSLPAAETTPDQPASYAGGGAGSGWGGPTSFDPTATATASNPIYGRGRAQEGLAGTGGGGGGFGPEGFNTGYGSGNGGPGILVIAYPKAS